MRLTPSLAALLLCSATALPLAAQTGPATGATTDSDDAVIDLTPMLDAMGAGTGTGTVAPDAANPAAGGDPAAPVFDADPAAALPAYTRSDDPAAGQSPAQSAGEAAPRLLPFTTAAPTRVLRLTGEVDRTRLDFRVDSPADVAELTLALRSSIDLLPAQSRLSLALNGQVVADFEPFAFDGFEMLRLPREALNGALQAGENRLDLTATGAHRIFCGPDASFQIWTEVDLAQSGIALTPSAVLSDPVRIRTALAAQILRHGRLTVQSAATPDEALLAALRARLTALSPHSAPALDLTSPYAPQTGSAGDLASVALVPADQPFIALRTGGGREVLVIGGTPDAAMLDAWLPAAAPAVDLAALDPARAPSAGLSLAALGAGNLALESRYSRVAVPFTLPEDWFLIAAQEAHIHLDYSYAAGLPADALLLVKINGTTVRLLPLNGAGNSILPTLDVGFPVRLLSAGANELSFEAIIPGDPPELPCAPVAGPFVRIAETTLIDIPPSPAMSVPRVASMLRALAPQEIALIAGATPGAAGDRTQRALAALITPVAGQETGAPLRMVVSGLGAVDRAPLDAIGLTRQRLEFLLAPQQVVDESAAPAPSTSDRLRAAGAALVQLADPGDGPLDSWLAGKTAQALLFARPAAGRQAPEGQAQDEAAQDEVWLIVAPTADPDAVARAVAAARFDPAGPKGEAALLRADGTWDNWQPASRMPALHEPLTLGNFRAVAGNYASWHPLYFVGILGLFVLVTVGLALSFITRTRGQRKR